MPKPKKTENEIKDKIRIIGIVVLFFGILFMFAAYFSKFNLLEVNNYRFEVYSRPDDITLDRFMIYYNFIREEGSISFILHRTNTTDSLEFTLPKEFNYFDLNWSNSKIYSNQNYTRYIEDKDYFIKVINDTYPPAKILKIYNEDKERKEYSTNFILNFKGRLYPNAEISFTPSGQTIRPRSGEDYGTFFRFYIGKRFSCSDLTDCYGSRRDNDLRFSYVKNQLSIGTVIENGKWKEVEDYLFYLNYNIENSRFDFEQIGLLLISLGFFPFLEIVILTLRKTKKEHN